MPRTPRPAAAVIVPAVEGRLRRTHDAWRREATRTPILRQRLADSSPFADNSRGVEHQAAALILEAVHVGVLGRDGGR
jgi:hypothetical protein